MSVELLFLRNQGHIAENAVAPLLIQCCEDSVIVGFRVAQPLARQHFLNTTKESNEAVFIPLTSSGSRGLAHPLGDFFNSSALTFLLSILPFLLFFLFLCFPLL